MGELEVRGPWVAAAYYRGTGAERFTDDGWFQTGDVVKIDARGYIRIRDRSKDLVKSGGEWISSVELENLLMAHPAVGRGGRGRRSQTSAGGSARWGSWVVKDGGRRHARRASGASGGPLFAKWQLPDRFEFIDALPRTATGKFKKTDLRERYVKTAV